MVPTRPTAQGTWPKPGRLCHFPLSPVLRPPWVRARPRRRTPRPRLVQPCQVLRRLVVALRLVRLLRPLPFWPPPGWMSIWMLRWTPCRCAQARRSPSYRWPLLGHVPLRACPRPHRSPPIASWVTPCFASSAWPQPWTPPYGTRPFTASPTGRRQHRQPSCWQGGIWRLGCGRGTPK